MQNDPAFAQALLDEAITLFINGDPESAKLILRDLLNTTVGFDALAEEIHNSGREDIAEGDEVRQESRSCTTGLAHESGADP